MTTFQQSPYLRDQRQFPNDDLRDLSNQVDHAYIDIASKVNARTVGVYAIGNPIVTGEKWYLSGGNTQQQTLRQVYQFAGAGNIAHGINFASITQFTRCWGTYTDGASPSNWYGVIFTTTVGLAGQVTFSLTPTNIVVVVDGAAPAVTSGSIVLEWLSQF